jgi:hypothetical protein
MASASTGAASGCASVCWQTASNHEKVVCGWRECEAQIHFGPEEGERAHRQGENRAGRTPGRSCHDEAPAVQKSARASRRSRTRRGGITSTIRPWGSVRLRYRLGYYQCAAKRCIGRTRCTISRSAQTRPPRSQRCSCSRGGGAAEGPPRSAPQATAGPPRVALHSALVLLNTTTL